MLSNHLIFCCPLPLPSTFPRISVFSNESSLHIRWPKYWSFSFSISPSNEYSGLISFRVDCWVSLMSKHHFRIVLGKDSASICWAVTFTYENKEKNGWNWSKSEEINSLLSPNYWNIKIFFITNFDSSKFIKLIRHNQLFCNFQKPILFFYFLFFFIYFYKLEANYFTIM